jgi:hypothetical protein
LRLTKRLGVLGLIALVLVFGGLLGGSVAVPMASAQTPGPGALAFTGTKSCVQPFVGGVSNNAGAPLVTDCTLTLTVPLAGIATITPGTSTASFTDILLDPNACLLPSFQLLTSGTASPDSIAAALSAGCSSGTNSVTTQFPQVIPTPTPTPLPRACAAPGMSTALTGTTVTITCTLPPIVVTGPTNLCEEVDLTLGGVLVGTTATTLTGKAQVCPPNPPIPANPVNPLTGVKVTKTCTPDFTGASASATKVTDCTLVFTTTTGNGQFNNGTTLEFDTITAGNAVFSAVAGLGQGDTTNDCENGVGNGGVLSNNNQTYTCVVGPIIVSGATTLCETVQIRDASGNSSAKINVCPTSGTNTGPTLPTTPPPSQVSFNLVPANAAIASCLKNGTAQAQVFRGAINDTMILSLSGFPPNVAFDLFTVQNNTNPFGLAWYQSDIETDSSGHAQVTIQTILLDQIFGFTSGGPVPPTNTFHVGFWFNDPNEAVALGCTASPVITPFNGEHDAGPLAYITQVNPATGLGPLCTEIVGTPPSASCIAESGPSSPGSLSQPGATFVPAPAGSGPPSVNFDLFPANAAIAGCLKNGSAHATVTRGLLNDQMVLNLSGFPPNLDFDLFTVQNNANPFGLSWYQSDIETDSSGNAQVTIQTILLDQIFGFTSGGPLPPTNTFHVGFWFNSPADAVALGCTAAPVVTPFNGQHTAGPLAYITHVNPSTGLGPLCSSTPSDCPSPPTPGPGSLQATSEQKTCTNTATAGALSQVIGGNTLPLSVSGPDINFTLPLFGPASTCAVQLVRNGVPCDLASNRCADGNVVITMTTQTGNGAVISCATGALPSGQTLPAVSSGTCQQQVLGSQLNIGCGSTANTPAASTTVSNSCTGVTFDIQSAIGACINTPNVCINNPLVNGGTFANLSATVTIQFLATPANSGLVGGIQLGTNTFTFQAPGIGTLLVQASPQLIPSNGTLASTVSATFACTTGFNLVNGVPLSNSSVPLTVTSVNGVNTITANSTTQCGAGLPGSFTFSSPGPVLFDNGRTTESVSCGPNSNVNVFGNGQPAVFNPIGSTFPLALTCTGAAVLAIGAGVAGDAPINVAYQSAVGGLSAVGSTLITVSPSGVPRISVACNPSTISAGNTGSLCTSTVTDIDGVPLNGITGATVTWTTSDTSGTVLLPCVIGTPGAINVTTSPQVIPLIQPQTPCQTPSSSFAGQANTFVNGQSTALLVAAPNAPKETVTISASLGVVVPPSFACLVSPYVPTLGFGTTPASAGYYLPTTSIGNPNYVAGCGTASPIGTTGLSTALNPAGAGLSVQGMIILPNTTSASTTVNIGGPAGIQVAGATPFSPIVLSRGCNSVVITSAIGTPVANIAALVSPANSVVSIWRFSNGTKLFNAGFFSDPNAPTDFALTGYLSGTTAPNGSNVVINGQTYSPVTGLASNVPGSAAQITETYYVCVNQQATMISG